jgi:hypothetical protein
MQDIITRVNPLNRATLIGKLRYYLLDRYYNRTLQLILITAAIALTLAATFMFREVDAGANPILGMALLAPIVAVAGFLLLYHNMHLSILPFMALSLLFWEGVNVGGGTKISFLFILILVWLVIWFLKMLLVEKKITIAPAAPNKLAWAFILATIISYFWAWGFVDPIVKPLYDSRFNPRTMTLIMFIISPLTFMFIATHVRSINVIRWFVIGFLATGLPFAYLQNTWQGLPGLINWQGQYPVWLIAIALGQVLYNQNLKLWLKALMLVMIGWWVYNQLGLGLSWLSGWVPTIFVIVFLMFNFSKRIFFLLVLLAVGWVIANASLLEANFARETEESGDTRELAWSTALEYTSRHLLFGMGPAGYAFYYALDNWPANFSHNNYIDIIAQTGLVGFTLFVSMWIAICWSAWQTYRLVPKHGFRGALAASLFACMVVVMIIMMLGDWVTPFTYTQGLFGINYTIWAWMLAGLTIALRYETLNAMKAEREAQELNALTAPAQPVNAMLPAWLR